MSYLALPTALCIPNYFIVLSLFNLSLKFSTIDCANENMVYNIMEGDRGMESSGKGAGIKDIKASVKSNGTNQINGLGILVNGVNLNRENFKTPPVELGILPFWFWNGEMDEAEMLYQMQEYKAKGIPGLFIHGRFGEKIGYLSDKWFERVRYTVDKAKEIGLQIWIYDEMNWPSGTAERKVIEKYPHLSQKYLELVALNVDGPLFTFLEATDSRYVNTGDSRPICAFACTDEEYKNGIKNLIDLTPNLSFNKVIPWEAPKGKWRLLYFLEKEVPYYIDALNPESTERFIELTHENYKKAVGNDFRKIVPGFYTDEPAMHYFQVGMDNYIIPWSKEMFRIFRDRRGYDLKGYLPALYMNMGKITSKIRYDFWRTLSEQYSDSYYKKIRQWCDENGVIFTGHVLFEEWLRLQARCEGNIFSHLRHMHITGVDHLYPKIGTEKEPDQHVALKLASSAAHHFGSTRLLCESMGGAYWDCTLERMKWIANWEYVLGVNLFNNHGYHYSIEGERKRDWPPSQFYHHTWWKFYNHFTSYMARLGNSLSGGRHVAKVLMLFPLTSVWTNYTPQKRSLLAKAVEDEFYYLTDTLLRLHYDYDYIDEDILTEASVRNGLIRLKDEEYSVMILPPVTHIKRSTFNLLKKFIQSGGKVITNTLLPVELLDDSIPGEITSTKMEQKTAADLEEISSIFGNDPVSMLKKTIGKTSSLANIFLNGNGAIKGNKKKQATNSKGNIIHLSSLKKTKEKRKAELRNALEKLISPDVKIDNEDVFYLHRVKDNYHIYFLVNTSQEDIGEVNVSFEIDNLLPELWNANSGEISEVNHFNQKDGRINLTLNFPASESHFVVFREKLPKEYITDTNLIITERTNENIKGYLKEENKSEKPYVKLKTSGSIKNLILKENKYRVPGQIRFPKEDYRFSTETDNVLLISKWKMKVLSDEYKDNDGISGFMSSDYDDSSWLNVTQGAWEMQLPVERDRETYPVRLMYRTSFIMDYIPVETGVKLLIDGFSGTDTEIYVNGNKLNIGQAKRSYLDAEIRELEIAEFLHTGENTIAAGLTAHRRTDGILDLLKITGNFSLSRTEEKKGTKSLSNVDGQKTGNVHLGKSVVFGSKSGHPYLENYKIVKPLEKMPIGDWTNLGYPYYSGTGIYQTEVEINENYFNGRLIFHASIGEDILEISVNDSPSKLIPWHPYSIDLTDSLRPGTNKITLRVTNTLINILEGVKKPSGLIKEPVITYSHLYEFSSSKSETRTRAGGKKSKAMFNKIKTDGKPKKVSQARKKAKSK